VLVTTLQYTPIAHTLYSRECPSRHRRVAHAPLFTQLVRCKRSLQLICSGVERRDAASRQLEDILRHDKPYLVEASKNMSTSAARCAPCPHFARRGRQHADSRPCDYEGVRVLHRGNTGSSGRDGAQSRHVSAVYRDSVSRTDYTNAPWTSFVAAVNCTRTVVSTNAV
jgi:hypothetical protein